MPYFANFTASKKSVFKDSEIYNFGFSTINAALVAVFYGLACPRDTIARELLFKVIANKIYDFLFRSKCVCSSDLCKFVVVGIYLLQR
jgi:hypothetical protein